MLLLNEQDQHAVIEGLRRGSREAWNRLYDGYSVDLWRYIARLVGPRSEDVADVVQETLLAAATAARGFDRQRGTLWSWLTGIAHNQTSLYWRRLDRTQRLKELAEAGAGELARCFDEQSGLDALERSERLDLVRYVLTQLTPDYALLLTAKYLDELSLEQLVGQCGGTTESLKSKLARARREFRRRFEQLSRDATELACDPGPSS